MTDWDVDSGALAALAVGIGQEAQGLVELARDVDRIAVGAADFGGETETGERYAEVVRVRLAGDLRKLAAESEEISRALSESAHRYDVVEDAASDLVARLGGMDP